MARVGIEVKWELPTSCSAVLVLDIRNGTVDGVDVGGSKVAMVADWPSGFLNGDGTGRLYFDPSVPQGKRPALEAVVTGRKGGVLEAMAAVIPNVEPSQEATINIEKGPEQTRLRVGDFVDLAIKQLRGPTGEPTKLLHGAASFRDEVALGKLSGSSRPPGMRAWQSEAGHSEHADMDWSG